jgi:hypothetical protein
MYQVFHTGSGSRGKSVQEVTVVNRTDRELELPPGVPLMVHVDEWIETGLLEGAKEAK